jgi:hypothetical protein
MKMMTNATFPTLLLSLEIITWILRSQVLDRAIQLSE